MINIQDIENKIINADCMDILKELPDKCVDLVLTDPPYGGGGGYLGSKRTRTLRRTLRQIPYQQHGQAGATSRNTCKGVSLTMIPILDIGTLRLNKKCLTRYSEFPKIKSSGAETTLNFRRQDVSTFGVSSQSAKNSQWLWQSMLGRLSTITRKYGNLPLRIRNVSIQHKNLSPLSQSKSNSTRKKETSSWIVLAEVELPPLHAIGSEGDLSALRKIKSTTKEVLNGLKKNKDRGCFYDQTL